MSRELDIEVAMKVMGWEPWVSPVQPRGSTTPDCWRTGDRRRPSVRISGWSPSTDIKAAWEVVEKCGLSVVRSEDGWYAMKPEDIVHDSPSAINLIGSEDAELSAYESAPLAICKAALAAVSTAGSSTENTK